jgi:hypothetical protein
VNGYRIFDESAPEELAISGGELAVAVPVRQNLRIGAYLARQKLARREQFPLIVELEPLFACNLACLGCGKIQYPAHILKQRMSVARAVAAVEECGAPGRRPDQGGGGGLGVGVGVRVRVRPGLVGAACPPAASREWRWQQEFQVGHRGCSRWRAATGPARQAPGCQALRCGDDCG